MWGNIAISFLLAFIVSFMVTPYSNYMMFNIINIFNFCNEHRRK